MINTNPVVGPVELTMGLAQRVLPVRGRAFSENTPVTDDADLDSMPREVWNEEMLHRKGILPMLRT